MGTYTNRIKLSNPASGACNWDTEWWRNQHIKDSIIAQLLNGDFVFSGCSMTPTTGLSVDVEAGFVDIDGTLYPVGAGTITATAASPDEVLENYVYVNDAGTTIVSTTPPAAGARFVLLGIIDAETTTILQVSDLRNLIVNKRFQVENDCINGTFDVWQRGNSQTSSGYGSDDRWQNINTGTTKTHTREEFALGQTDVPGNPKYYSRTNVVSVAGAGNYCIKSHRMEDVTKYSGKRVCVTFWAKADAAKDMAIEGVQSFGSGGSAGLFSLSVTTVSLTTSWQKYVVFIDFPSVSGATLGDITLSMILFWMDAGSNHDGRTNSLGQQSGVFDLAEVEIYESDRELPTRRRTYQETFWECLYYCWRTTDAITAFGNAHANNCSIGARLSFPRIMRGIPNYTLTGAFSYYNSDTGTINAITDRAFNLFCNSTATTTYAHVRVDGDATNYAVFDAEV